MLGAHQSPHGSFYCWSDAISLPIIRKLLLGNAGWSSTHTAASEQNCFGCISFSHGHRWEPFGFAPCSVYSKNQNQFMNRLREVFYTYERIYTHTNWLALLLKRMIYYTRERSLTLGKRANPEPCAMRSPPPFPPEPAEKDEI